MFLSIVFSPRPVATVSSGRATVIMFTMGMMTETAPTKATALSMVTSVVVPLLKTNSRKPAIAIRAPMTMAGLGPAFVTSLPIPGPATSIKAVPGATVNPAEIGSSPRPAGCGSSV
jgi:hypothetical protein